MPGQAAGALVISGVATSITAFIGRALRGPVGEATTITSYAEFEGTFGGLWTESRLAYAVSDFFENGGSTALVARVFRPTTDDTAQIDLGPHLTLEAASPGAWGSGLTARVDHDVGPGDATLFNLTITDTAAEVTEIFRDVSNAPDHPRRVDHALAAESRLATVVASDAGRPAVTAATASTGGSDGGALDDETVRGSPTTKTGLHALDAVDLVNLLVVPPYTPAATLDQVGIVPEMVRYAATRRAVAILDPGADWTVADAVTKAAAQSTDSHAAVYFPWIRKADPLRGGQIMPRPPSGAIAGVIARTDANRAVWKAPAGSDAQLSGVAALDVPLTDVEIGRLSAHGVNCLRAAPQMGHVVWGARTRAGDDRSASEWKYLPVRRMALFLEESLSRGTQWVVFEPNGEPLWAQIRLGVGEFMHTLFRQGAFQGSTPRDAYYVKCDAETTTQSDIDRGVVNIVVGFAPIRPGEFVRLRVQHLVPTA